MASSKKRAKIYAAKVKATFLVIAVAVALLLYAFPGLRAKLSEYFPFMDPPREETPVTGDLDVHFIDVGQGDASLILTPEGNAMLIDTGESSEKELLIAYIESLGVDALDYLVLTHPHSDHIGGASAILSAFEVKAVLMPDAETDTATFLRVLEAIDEEGCGVTVPKVNDTVTLGSAVFTVLGPVDSYRDLNDTSLVLRMDYGSTSFLFTGDAEVPSEEDMLARHPSSAFKADVLKLGHHGSSTSTSTEFLSAVLPTYAVASCGENNEYGHPHRETLSLLTNKNITLLRTDEDGSVVFTSNGSKVMLLTPSTRS